MLHKSGFRVPFIELDPSSSQQPYACPSHETTTQRSRNVGVAMIQEANQCQMAMMSRNNARGNGTSCCHKCQEFVFACQQGQTREFGWRHAKVVAHKEFESELPPFELPL